MSAPLAYYIDDEKGDSKAYIERLKVGGRMNVKYEPPPPNLTLRAFAGNPEMFFVDWELDTAGKGGIHVGYKGSTLAARLREKYEDYPIMLVTRDNILDPRESKRYVRKLYFDDLILKRDISADSEQVIQRCLALIAGFRSLRAADKDWRGLLNALGASQDEYNSLGEAAPPLEKLSTEFVSVGTGSHSHTDAKTTWRVPEMAAWIRDVLLKFPGILYDSMYAATYLGISVQDFLSKEVQGYVESCKYTGAFAPVEGRWWKTRLFDTARNIIDSSTRSGDSVNRGFAAAFEEVYSKKIKPSKCIVSGETPADWVCYVLHEPVRVEYSLIYHPDQRPPIMDDARVSYKAIRDSDNVFDEYFDESSQQLLEEIREEENEE